MLSVMFKLLSEKKEYDAVIVTNSLKNIKQVFNEWEKDALNMCTANETVQVEVEYEDGDINEFKKLELYIKD